MYSSENIRGSILMGTFVVIPVSRRKIELSRNAIQHCCGSFSLFRVFNLFVQLHHENKSV